MQRVGTRRNFPARCLNSIITHFQILPFFLLQEALRLAWPYTSLYKRHPTISNRSVLVYSQVIDTKNNGIIANTPSLHNHYLCWIYYWPVWKHLQCVYGNHSSFKDAVKSPWELAKDHLGLFILSVILGIMIMFAGVIGR